MTNIISKWKLNLDARATPPDDVLAALIESYYAPVLSLVIGSANAIIVAVVAADRTGQRLFDDCAVLLTVVFLARMTLVWRYRRRDQSAPATAQSLHSWELAYAIGAYSFAASLGALGVIALLDTRDPVSHMLVYALNMGFLAGAATRNSAIRQIAIWQILLTLAPMAVAAALQDQFEYYVVAFITLLYCLAGVEICNHQSTNTLRTLLANKENGELAERLAEQNLRFDAALNNMPQGLCMFDSDGRLVVCNQRFRENYGSGPVSLTPGMTIREVADRFVEVGALTPQSAMALVEDLNANLRSRRSIRSEFALPNGRIVSKTQTSILDGGAVILFEDVTERNQAAARVRYLATHDMLTGLPNRTLFTQLLREEIDTAERASRQFCVLFIDLDRFKIINDTLGHAAGDALLREASTRLKNCLSERDLVARLGGDEFVVVLRNIRAQSDALAKAEKILACLNAAMVIAGQECGVTASIGAALYPADGRDEDTLLKNADAAMYLAKAEGKSVVRLFSPKIKTQTLQSLMLETSMRHALERDEFVVWYQPQREIAGGALTGVEALLRWRHPELGLLSPDRFIPLAEETGLIAPIGKWVMETACAQIMAWRARGMEPLSVAVNLSLRQLHDKQLVRHIEEALKASGMEPRLLELEITESMVMQDSTGALAALGAIKNMGVRLAIDDFGTGYSSLSLVKQMPLDAIKIDRSFINDLLNDPNDRAIAEAVISLGRALRLRVIAEGVETAAQEAFLRERGCAEMQGYLFSRPLEADELFAFVSEYNLRRLRGLSDRERAAAVKRSA